MTAYFIAISVALALALLRLSATCFEAAFYHWGNGQRRRAFNATLKALFFVGLLAIVISPAVRFFDSFEVLTIEQPSIDHSPKPSKGLRV